MDTSHNLAGFQKLKEVKQFVKKKLCKPCAVMLQEQGKTVVFAKGCQEKITCDECGKRRFGCIYEVTGRKKRASANT